MQKSNINNYHSKINYNNLNYKNIKPFKPLLHNTSPIHHQFISHNQKNMYQNKLNNQPNSNSQLQSNSLIFSFTDSPCQSNTVTYQFCKQMQCLSLVLQNSVKITDPIILMVNSSDKAMVEQIYTENQTKKDSKSQQLTERISKYLNILQRVKQIPKCKNLVNQSPKKSLTIVQPKQIKKIQIFIDDLFDSNQVKATKTSSGLISREQIKSKPKSDKNRSVSKFISNKSEQENSNRLRRTFDRQKVSIKHYSNNSTKIFKNINITAKKVSPQPFCSPTIISKKQQSKYKISKRVNKSPINNKNIKNSKCKNITWNTIECTRNFNKMLKMMKSTNQ